MQNTEGREGMAEPTQPNVLDSQAMVQETDIPSGQFEKVSVCHFRSSRFASFNKSRETVLQHIMYHIKAFIIIVHEYIYMYYREIFCPLDNIIT